MSKKCHDNFSLVIFPAKRSGVQNMKVVFKARAATKKTERPRLLCKKIQLLELVQVGQGWAASQPVRTVKL